MPEYEAMLSTQYTRHVGQLFEQDIQATGRIDARFGGSKAWDDFNSAFSKEIQIFNTSVNFAVNKWQLNLFVNNVLDEDYFTNYVAGFRFPFAGGDALGVRGAPRHWGMSVQYDY